MCPSRHAHTGSRCRLLQDRITQEFFRQGDLEREAGIPISPFMDRRAANNVAKNQAGFFQFLVQPV